MKTENTYAETPQATDEPRPMKPRFMLFSHTLPLTPRDYYNEGDARRDAEQIARAHRGHEISVLFTVATVTEPLPNLEWSDGAPAGAGDGRLPDRIMGLAADVSMGLDAAVSKITADTRTTR